MMRILFCASPCSWASVRCADRRLTIMIRSFLLLLQVTACPLTCLLRSSRNPILVLQTCCHQLLFQLKRPLIMSKKSANMFRGKRRVYPLVATCASLCTLVMLSIQLHCGNQANWQQRIRATFPDHQGLLQPLLSSQQIRQAPGRADTILQLIEPAAAQMQKHFASYNNIRPHQLPMKEVSMRDHEANTSQLAAGTTEQRPNSGSLERVVTSEKFQQLTAHSLNPPPTLTTLEPLVAKELQSRLVIGIVSAVKSAQNEAAVNFTELHLIKTELDSLMPTLEPAFLYRIYVAFDEGDHVYSLESLRAAVDDYVSRKVAVEDAKRWHPQGYQPGVTVDNTTLLVSVHWVHCNYTGKPTWSQNDAAVAAFKEGADYVLRTNDDTEMPRRKDWVSAFIADLQNRHPFPNVGVVGPASDKPPVNILTHDFTHKTHVVIHGFYYPRSLPTWYADNWITEVYSGYKPALMVKRDDYPVDHKLAPQRYLPVKTPGFFEMYQQQLDIGKAAIRAFTQRQFNATPAAT